MGVLMRNRGYGMEGEEGGLEACPCTHHTPLLPVEIGHCSLMEWFH